MRWPVEAAVTTLAVVLLALVVRLPFFLESDFPLNDGGLFFVMSREVASSHYWLPSATHYNGDAIPFAYPPLPFYLTALLAYVLAVPEIVVVRYLPLVANLLTVVAFVAFARSLFRSPRTAFFAAAAFVLVPRSYEWLVMGGGLTRSVGLLFAVAALAQAVALYQRPTAGRIAVVGALVAGTMLSHMEMGLFVTYSYLLFFLAYGRSKGGLGVSLVVTLAVAIFTAPWWLTVLHHHGLEPYRAASATAGWSSLDQVGTALSEFVFPLREPFWIILGGLGVLGLLACLLRGELLVPAWLPLVFLLTPRSAATEATIPLAALIGVGVGQVVLPGLGSVARQPHGVYAWLMDTPPGRALQHVERRAFLVTATSTVLFGFAVLPYLLPADFGAFALEALPDGERQSMAWIAANTPEASAFLVLSPKASWEADYVLEWFPALAARKSVLTPQGAEWLAVGTHTRRVCLYNQFRAEAMRSLDSMEQWLSRMHVPYTHVYVSKMVHGPIDLEDLRAALVASPDYQVLLDDAGATVLARTEPAFPVSSQPSEPPIAPDCQTLFQQPRPVQATYYEAHGPRAPWAWVEDHSRELTRRRRW
jgi:hypothetical protein